jgi:phosphate transport system protein
VNRDKGLAMTNDHIVKKFDEALARLDNAVAEMGGLAEHQLNEAVEALADRNIERAVAAVAADGRIDRMERFVDQEAIALLALRQPMASDLRVIISALKTSGVIERIGDYAKNIAKRTAAVAEMPPVPSVLPVVRLGRLTQRMVKDVLDAYGARDVTRAEDVRRRDAEVDALYTSIFRELLTYMMEDPRNISACSHLLFVAKNLERVGDHATNIAENVIFMVSGTMPADEREKSDETDITVEAAAT